WFRLFHGLGALNQVINVDAAQGDRNRPLRFGQCWPQDVIDQGRPSKRELFDVLESRRGAQNVVGRNAISIAPELITAVRSTDAPEDAVPHQRLQNRLEVTRRAPRAGPPSPR